MSNPPIRCFLIDDDPDDQEIFNLALQQVDPCMTCAVASDCLQGLSMLSDPKAVRPSYIFVDLNMPKMNGKECLREIKKLAHLSKAQLILYSTSLAESDVAEAKKLGANGFLIKPNSIETLAAILEHYFRTSELPEVSQHLTR